MKGAMIGAVMGAVLATYATQPSNAINPNYNSHNSGIDYLTAVSSQKQTVDSKLVVPVAGSIDESVGAGQPQSFASDTAKFKEELSKYRAPERFAYAVRWGVIVIPEVVPVVQESGNSVIFGLGIQQTPYLCVFFKYKDNASGGPYDGFQMHQIIAISEKGIDYAERPIQSTLVEKVAKTFNRDDPFSDYEILVMSNAGETAETANSFFKSFNGSTLSFAPPKNFEIHPITKRLIKDNADASPDAKPKF